LPTCFVHQVFSKRVMRGPWRAKPGNGSGGLGGAHLISAAHSWVARRVQYSQTHAPSYFARSMRSRKPQRHVVVSAVLPGSTLISVQRQTIRAHHQAMTDLAHNPALEVHRASTPKLAAYSPSLETVDAASQEVLGHIVEPTTIVLMFLNRSAHRPPPE